MAHRFCLLMAHYRHSISITPLEFFTNGAPLVRISIWYANGTPGSAPLVCNTMRHQYASRGTICNHLLCHTNGAFSVDAPLVSFGILMAHLVVMRHQYEYLFFFAFLIFAQVTKYIIGQNIDSTTQQQQIHRIQQKISLRIQFIILVSEFKRPNKDRTLQVSRPRVASLSKVILILTSPTNHHHTTSTRY